MTGDLLVYLQITTVIFLSVFIILPLVKTAPARLKFYLCVFALGCMFIPWSSLKVPSSSMLLSDVQLFSAIELNNLTENDQPLSELNPATLAGGDNDHQPAANQEPQVLEGTKSQSLNVHFSFIQNLNWWMLLVLMCSLGCLWFLKDVWAYFHFISRLKKHSVKDEYMTQELFQQTQRNIPIRLINEGVPGMATGVLRPTIWIDTRVQDKDMIVLHEYTHTQQNDTLWLWLITLTQRIFWWHPLVHLFCRYARFYMELSCDESCSKSLSSTKYATSLANILRESVVMKPYHYSVTNIKLSKKLNIRRMEEIMKEKKFVFKHLVAVLLGFFLMGIISLSLANKSDLGALTDNSIDERSADFNSLKEKYRKNIDKALESDDATLMHSVATVLTDMGKHNEALSLIKTWEENHLSSIKEDNKRARSTKILFQAFTYIFSSVEDYQSILDAYHHYYGQNTDNVAPVSIDIARAISEAKLDRVDKAIDILEERMDDDNSSAISHRRLIPVLAYFKYVTGEYRDTVNLLSTAGDSPQNIKLLVNAYLRLEELGKAKEIQERYGLSGTNINLRLLFPRIPRTYYNTKLNTAIHYVGFDWKKYPIKPAFFPDNLSISSEVKALVKDKKFKDAINLSEKYLAEQQQNLSDEKIKGIYRFISRRLPGIHKNNYITLAEELLGSDYLDKNERLFHLYQLTNTHIILRQYPQALKYIKQYEEEAGEVSIRSMITRAKILNMTRKHKEALPIFKNAIKRIEDEGKPKSHRLYLSVAGIYARSSDFENALKYYELAYELYPSQENKAHIDRTLKILGTVSQNDKVTINN